MAKVDDDSGLGAAATEPNVMDCKRKKPDSRRSAIGSKQTPESFVVFDVGFDNRRVLQRHN